jgi:hypothetical protein
MSVDTLWQLDEALRRTPQWSAFYIPHLSGYDSESDNGDSSTLIKSQGRRKRGAPKRPPKKMLAITDGRADESDGSMPSLQSVSDSSGDSDDDILDSDDFDDDDDSDEYETESGYDTDEEEQYRAMLREAMDAAMAIPEFFDAKTEVPEFEAMAEERKGNPFLKLLGSLRGRVTSFHGRSFTYSVFGMKDACSPLARSLVLRRARNLARALSHPNPPQSRSQLQRSKLICLVFRTMNCLLLSPLKFPGRNFCQRRHVLLVRVC